MALKPTIYKFRIDLSDTNRDKYEALSLTVALHPSETVARMLARVLALGLNAQEGIALTKGLSTTEEPDVWIKELDDSISLWIEVGEPDPDRVKKACRLAKQVCIYTFTSKTDAWWNQVAGKVSYFPAKVFRLAGHGLDAMAEELPRTLDLGMMVSEQTIYLTLGDQSFEVEIEELQ
ncbi:YaeQ family protein [Vibrio sonorensis]|uniref:YaeQ family protein n=1 Tax=Vibrio sonorensis TaxID=1004316 RepID=UPI0008D9A861|nr:YaeQ family protein [Vibrio sonorensis]